MMPTVVAGYETFSDFYAVYLRQHDHPVNRKLHVLGNALGAAAVAGGMVARSWWPVVAAPLLVNACHWLGHLAFQKNRPVDAAPRLYAAIASWKMAWDVLVHPKSLR